MLKSFAQLLGRNYEALNVIEVSEKSLAYNYKYLSSLNQRIKVAPVLKSNAYGHGIAQVGKILEKENPPFICVDSLFEAYELSKAGIKTKILIMGFIGHRSVQTKNLPFSFAVFDLEQIKVLNEYQPGTKVHIFVDTGMRREGVILSELDKFVSYIKNKTNLEIEGLMSHFAASDKPNDSRTKEQVKNFQKAEEILKENGISPKWIHIANSSGMINSKKLGKIGNMARVGLALYGVDPEGKDKKLRPALELKTHVAQIKHLRAGDRVGYDFTYQAKTDMKIAVLPIGYFDGVDRRLSNKGFVKIGKIFCPIIGRVSMNITVVNVTNLKQIKVGNEVIIYSATRGDKNSIENSAAICGVINYELPTYLSPTTKRIIV